MASPSPVRTTPSRTASSRTSTTPPGMNLRCRFSEASGSYREPRTPQHCRHRRAEWDHRLLWHWRADPEQRGSRRGPHDDRRRRHLRMAYRRGRHAHRLQRRVQPSRGGGFGNNGIFLEQHRFTLRHRPQRRLEHRLRPQDERPRARTTTRFTTTRCGASPKASAAGRPT